MGARCQCVTETTTASAVVNAIGEASMVTTRIPTSVRTCYVPCGRIVVYPALLVVLLVLASPGALVGKQVVNE